MCSVPSAVSRDAETGTEILKAAFASAGWAERLTEDRRDDDEF